MSEIPKEVVIIGGGASIKEGIALGLKDKIKDKFVIGVNFAFYHFDCTLITTNDKAFYRGQLNKNNKHDVNEELVEKIKNFPLIISKDYGMHFNYFRNTVAVKTCCQEYHREKCLKDGFYNGYLTGIFSITLASFLMNYVGVIYLLGFDFTRREKKDIPAIYNENAPNLETHYYSDKEINHRGQHWVGFYERHDPERLFAPFISEKQVKIFNVSSQSNINSFEKIDYTTMFDMLRVEIYNQDELRTEIRNKLLPK